MTIKQQGGVFGRNPTFNNVEVDGTATLDSIASGAKLEIKGSDNPAAYIEFENTFQNAGIATQAGLLLGVNSSVQTNYAGVIATEQATNSNGVLLGLYANNGAGPILVAQARNNKNFEIVDGDLVVASGHGIDFSATSGTGTSELFDDYEEGLAGGITLSPETSGSFTVNAALDTLAYTKVGRLVSITGMISCTNVSAVGTFVELDGLPFAAADLTETAGRFTGMAQFDGTSGKPSVVGIALEGWTKIRFPIVASTVTGNIYVNINYIAA